MIDVLGTARNGAASSVRARTKSLEDSQLDEGELGVWTESASRKSRCVLH